MSVRMELCLRCLQQWVADLRCPCGRAHECEGCSTCSVMVGVFCAAVRNCATAFCHVLLFFEIRMTPVPPLGRGRGKPSGTKTTNLLKDTSLETIESQTQLDKLHERLQNCAEAERPKGSDVVGVGLDGCTVDAGERCR